MLQYTDLFTIATVFHSQTLYEELKRNAEHLIPTCLHLINTTLMINWNIEFYRYIVSFVILVAFATLCTTATVKGLGFPFVDWVLSKPFLATAGVAGAGMGVASAIGLLKFCGFYYNQIVLVMPFLVVFVLFFLCVCDVCKPKMSEHVRVMSRSAGQHLSDDSGRVAHEPLCLRGGADRPGDIRGCGIDHGDRAHRLAANIPAEEMVQADYYRAVYNCVAINFNQRYRLNVLWDTPVDMDHFTTNFTAKPNTTALR